MSLETEELSIGKHLQELEEMINGPNADGLAPSIHKKQTFLIRYILNQIKGLAMAKAADKRIITAQQATISDLRVCIVKLEDAQLPERTKELEDKQDKLKELPVIIHWVIDHPKTAAIILGLYFPIANYDKILSLF